MTITEESKVPVSTERLGIPSLGKKKRGRPKKNSNFVSELPAPPVHETFKADEFFGYLRSIPVEKRSRGMLSFYRYLPACDITEGGKYKDRDKCIRKIPLDNHPFVDEDWEKQILHLFGCGNYGCYLNEQAPGPETGAKTIMMCRKIETLWDPDSFPPVLDPKTIIESFDKNGAYIQWLRNQGVQLPSEVDHEKEELEVQIAETINKLTDTVIAQANRANTPVPQIQQQPSMAEKLTFESAKAAIDMVTEQAKVTGASHTKAENPIDMAQSLVAIAERMSGGNKGSDDTLKLFLQDAMKRAESEASARRDAEQRHNDLMMRMFEQRQTSAASNQPKSLLDQMREMAEMRNLMKDAFGIAGDTAAGGDDEEKLKGDSWPVLLLQNLPTFMQYGTQMWGNFNQTMAFMTRQKELEVIKATGQVPQGVQPPQAQPQAMQAAQPEVLPPQQTLNPETQQPMTEAELDAIRQETAAYAQYHPFIASIALPLITHMNDSAKDGYDFAQWFIEGQGKLMYGDIKKVPPDKLWGAVKTFQPQAFFPAGSPIIMQWGQMVRDVEKAQEFLGEFLTLDELPPEVGAANGVKE